MPDVDFADVDSHRIAYRAAGTGPPLVLLHGGWSDSRDWRPQLDGLADRFEVIAWDTPGCGQSSDPPARFSLSDYADVLAGLLHTLDLAPVHLCGLSWGGGLAIEIYHHHPHLVRTMILAGAYAGWAGSLPANVVQQRLQRALTEADQPPEQWVDSYLPGFFAGPVPEALLDEVKAIMSDARPAGIKPMLTAFADADLRHVLPTIEVPTLLLYGEHDTRSPVDIAEELHRNIPDSQLVVLPDIGHMANLEAPDAFNTAVREFLLSAEARTRSK